MHKRDAAEMSPALWARIDTTASTITASNGAPIRYSLERVRRWNIGLRRHHMALTGEIRVHAADGRSEAVECWIDAIILAERYR